MLFADTSSGYASKSKGVVTRSKPLKLLYLDSVKQFGKRDGLNIYHKVKQII